MKLRAWDVERKKNKWNETTEAEKNTHPEKAARAQRLYRAQQNPEKKEAEHVTNKEHMKKLRQARARLLIVVGGITIEKHKIDICGKIVHDYRIFHNVPVAECLEFVHALDAPNYTTKCLTRSRDTSEGRWEGQYQGLGYIVYYFRSHLEKLSDQVV